jgi:hypothetical protein
MVRGSHASTIELTKEGYLTEEGDCIIGVQASHGCSDLNERLKNALKREGSRVRVRISAQEMEFELEASGDHRLLLTDPHDIVIRKSDFVSSRTLAVRADAAARDIPRELIRVLKDPKATGRLEIEVT